jgi:hypothetical protein
MIRETRGSGLGPRQQASYILSLILGLIQASSLT